MIFELTLAGFDGSDDSTDHLVKWIRADNQDMVEGYALALGLKGYSVERAILPDDLGFQEGVDVILELKQTLSEKYLRVHPRCALHVVPEKWKDESPEIAPPG